MDSEREKQILREEYPALKWLEEAACLLDTGSYEFRDNELRISEMITQGSQILESLISHNNDLVITMLVHRFTVHLASHHGARGKSNHVGQRGTSMATAIQIRVALLQGEPKNAIARRLGIAKRNVDRQQEVIANLSEDDRNCLIESGELSRMEEQAIAEWRASAEEQIAGFEALPPELKSEFAEVNAYFQSVLNWMNAGRTGPSPALQHILDKPPQEKQGEAE